MGKRKLVSLAGVVLSGAILSGCQTSRPQTGGPMMSSAPIMGNTSASAAAPTGTGVAQGPAVNNQMRGWNDRAGTSTSGLGSTVPASATNYGNNPAFGSNRPSAGLPSAIDRSYQSPSNINGMQTTTPAGYSNNGSFPTTPGQNALGGATSRNSLPAMPATGNTNYMTTPGTSVNLPQTTTSGTGTSTSSTFPPPAPLSSTSPSFGASSSGASLPASGAPVFNPPPTYGSGVPKTTVPTLGNRDE